MKVEQKVKAVKQEKSYGTLHLNSGDTPFVKKATIGQMMEVTVTLKITELRQPDRWDISEGKMKLTDVMVRGNIVKIEEAEMEGKKEPKEGGV